MNPIRLLERIVIRKALLERALRLREGPRPVAEVQTVSGTGFVLERALTAGCGQPASLSVFIEHLAPSTYHPALRMRAIGELQGK